MNAYLKSGIVVAAALSLSGCKPKEQWVVNQELRQEIFFRCLAAAGPHGSLSFSTVEEGAAGDVVRACEESAYYQALELKVTQ